MRPTAAEHPPLLFAVLWDVDGTIVDSAPYHYRAWQVTLAEEGVCLDEATFRRTFGWRNDAIIAELLGPAIAAERATAIATAKERRYREYVGREGIAALPGALLWIERLYRRGIPQAIVSSAPAENNAAVLGALGISDLFQTIISGDEVRRGKPDPALFLLAAQRLGIAPRRCVVVEDAPAGVTAARRAGMACIAVATTYPRQELAAVEAGPPTIPMVIVDSLAGLAEDTFDRLAQKTPWGRVSWQAR